MKKTSLHKTSTAKAVEFIVVYGPPDSGKTINLESLRKHYRCTAAIDDACCVERWQLRGLSGRVLLTSSDERMRDPYDRRRPLKCRMVHVDDAEKALGAKWVRPMSFRGRIMAKAKPPVVLEKSFAKSFPHTTAFLRKLDVPLEVIHELVFRTDCTHLDLLPPTTKRDTRARRALAAQIKNFVSVPKL